MSRFLLFLFVALLARAQFAQAVCGDGILDVGELCDTALSACCAPGCLSILPSTTICRPSAGGCDVPEYCTGTSATCPPDLFRPAGYECRPIAPGSLCDVPEFCTGNGPQCPVDMAASNKTVCRTPGPGLECVQTQYCPGTLPSQDPNAKACPADVALSSQTRCRYKCSQCDVTEYCPGPGAPGQFACPIDYNLATTTNTSYFNSCTLRGMYCASGSCSSGGTCNEGYSQCSGPGTTCPSSCKRLYDPFMAPHITKHEWNRCIQDRIVDYNGVSNGITHGEPGFTDGVFDPLPQNNFACDITSTYMCKRPDRIADPSNQGVSRDRTHCYIGGAYWFDHSVAYSMGTYSIDSVWEFEPSIRSFLLSINSTLRPYIYADLLAANPDNTCQRCVGGSSADPDTTNPPSTWTNKAAGAYCLLPESLRATNNPCANQVLGAVGQCQGGVCVPFLETNVTNWGRECRAAKGPCDKPEYCSQDGSSPYCPPDKLRGEDESWLYYTVDSEFPEGFNRIGLYSSIMPVLNRPALAYSARRGSGQNHAVFYAINSQQEATGAWSIVIVEDSMNVDTLPHVDAAVINGRPAIVWTVGSDIWFGVSNGNDGLSGWTNNAIGNSNFVSTSYSDPVNLFEVLGRPAIMYINPSDIVYYAINSNTDGSGTWTYSSVDVILGGTGVGPCSGVNDCGQHAKPMIVAGRPAAAFVNDFSISSTPDVLGFVISTSPDGIGGAGNWVKYIVSSGDVANLPISMNIIDGRPAILYRCNGGTYCLRFAINANADGSGPWTITNVPMPSTLPDHCSGNGLFTNGCRLMEWRNRPYIALIINEQIYYGTNSAADGSGTWTYTTDGEYAGSYGIFPDNTPLHITKIGNTPSMVYQRGDFYGPLLSGSCPTPQNTTLPEIVKYATIDSFECRAKAGSCDIPEYCSGFSTECPADSVQLAGTTPVGVVIRGPCEMIAPCDGVSGTSGVNGTIAKGPTHMCRPASGPCDAPEFCPDPNLVAEWWLCPSDEYYNSTQICRSSTGLCDPPEYCSGTSPTCDAPDLLSPNGTICRSAVGLCDVAETCDGVSATCPADTYKTAGTSCRAIMGPCDLAEQCNGTSPFCPADSFVQAGTVCLAARGPCEGDHTCSGSSAACPVPTPFNSTVQCRMSAGACDLADFCPGNSYNCSADAKLPLGTSCRAAADLCDLEEVCDGVSNNCPADLVHSAGFVCRTPRGPCEIPKQCDGVSVVCPAEEFRNSQFTCRASAGLCDVAENCDPFATEPWLCPTDAFVPAGSLCATSVGACSENGLCTGTSSACPGVTILNSTVECRPAQTQCDQADFCDGVSEVCPQTYLPAGTSCVANPLNCTVDECDGSGVCQVVQDNCDCMANIDCALNVTATCFTATCVDGFCVEELAAGFCYIDGVCYGDQVQNPMNPCLRCDAQSMNRMDWAFSPPSTPCNTGNATGLCSAPDTCNGMGVCVDNFLSAGTVCRQSTGLCDAEEQCTGSSDFCPMDVFAPQGTLCRNATGPCDLEEYCDNMGQCPSDAVEPAGTVCLASRGVCEEDGVCDGANKECGARLLLPSGTQCRPATLPCDVPETCDGQNFDCPADLVQPSSHTCRMAAGPCDQPETCDGLSKFCPADILLGPAQLCRMASGSCENDGYCTLNTTQCEPVSYKPAGTVCQSSTSLCAQDATCDGVSEVCPALAPLPNGTQCFTPRGPCEGPGFCNGVSLTCQTEGLKPAGTVCRVSLDPVCDPQETCNPSLPNPWLCPADYKQPDGFPCPDSIFCNGDESCQAGVCTMGPTRDCSDGSPCTTDTCNEMSAVCVHTPLPQIGTVCYDGPMGTADVGVCRSGTTQCFGNGTLYCANQILPGPMEICGDGLDNDCDGAPDNGCAGVTCVTTGDCTPFIPSSCQTAFCNTQTNFCEYPVLQGECLIGGQSCVSGGAVDPFNPCRTCQPQLNQNAYTPDDSQNPSDNNLCNGVEICQGGQVVLSQPPPICPVSNNTCTPFICDGTLGCIQGALPEGSVCTLQFPYACDEGISVCDVQNQCVCETGNLIDVRDTLGKEKPGEFDATAIVLTSIFGGAFLLFGVVLALIAYFGRRRQRRKKSRKQRE